MTHQFPVIFSENLSRERFSPLLFTPAIFSFCQIFKKRRNDRFYTVFESELEFFFQILFDLEIT